MSHDFDMRMTFDTGGPQTATYFYYFPVKTKSVYKTNIDCSFIREIVKQILTALLFVNS